MLKEYIFLIIFLFICFFVVTLMLLGSIWIVQQKLDMDKGSPYECGLNVFEDVRSKFEIRFFLIGLLFIVFDLEIAFLLPWVIIFSKGVSLVSLCILIFFLILLFFCFFFEWQQGALDWE